MNGNSNSF